MQLRTEEWVVRKLHTWGSPILYFVILKAHLMIPSRVVGSKVLSMAIQFGYFFWLKRQMANVMLEIFHSFSLVWVPDVPSFKVLVFTIKFQFQIGVNEY